MRRSPMNRVSDALRRRREMPSEKCVTGAAWTIGSLEVFVAAALLLSTLTFALAQHASNPVFATTPPAREGGIYDFRNHQPTAPRPSAVTTQQVEDEVNALLKQVDKVDRQFGSREGRR
jgi:hypothetical protein